MKLLFDFFPVLLFFLAYKIYGIYTATAIAIVASLIQAAYFWMRFRKVEKMQLIGCILIVVFGGATLLLHDPWFIKWKPTAIYWITALFFFLSPYFNKQSFIEKMLEETVILDKHIWKRLNIAWISFFLFMGIANLYVALHYSTDQWVNFKLFGGTGLTLLFVLMQAIYLSKMMILKKTNHSTQTR